jgi:hypothetical protein
MASEPALAIIRQFDRRVDALYLECFRASLEPHPLSLPTGISKLASALCLACALQGGNWLLRRTNQKTNVRVCLHQPKSSGSFIW